MGNYNAAVMTDAGAAMLAQSQMGSTLTFTRFGTGNGIYADKSIDALKVLTNLKSQKQSFLISGKSSSEDEVKVTTVISNEDLTSSYYINEIGLFAKIDNGAEALFSICVATTDNSTLFEAYNGETPITMTQTFVIKTSNASEIVVVLPSDVYALASDLEAHENQQVASQTGVHGLRYYDDTLAKYNDTTHEWDEIQTGGGGSTITVITEDALLVGGTVTLTGDGEPVTGIMPSTGSIVFEGVPMTGTITVTVENGSETGTDTLAVPYFGNYEVEVATGVINAIEISTTETTLYGKTITATYGGNTKTTTFSGEGTATIKIIDFTGEVTLTSTDGTDTATSKVNIVSGTTSYTATLAFVYVYGASWDGTSTTLWSRTDAAEGFTDPVPAINNGNGSSPFDDISPWKDITKVSDATAGTLVKIPKFYYKITQSGSGMKIQVSAKQFEGSSVSPAHMNRGDGKGERDEIYVGRYHCASTYKSTSGVKPVANITRSAARSSIHNLGSAYWQFDFATQFTIWLLYIVEFANWDSQAKIGYGCGNNSATENAGLTDAMTYHTGTNAASRTTYGHVQYRWIEDLWANVYDWMDGCFYSSSGMNVILNPSSFSDTSGGVNIGTPSSGWPSAFTVKNVSGSFPTFIPTAASGSATTYSCDYWYFNASGPCLYVGGSYSQSQACGLFYVDYCAATYTGAGIGCRLLKLP